jgi:hypothetical protein
MMHPDDRENVFGAAEELVRSGVHAAAEHRVVRPTGEVRTVQAIGTVKRDASGRVYEYLVRCDESHCFPPKVSAHFPAAFSDSFPV